MIKIREKKFEEAMAFYAKALEIDPNNLEAHYQKGIVYAFQEKFDEALVENRKALEINHKHANSQFNIAVIYHKKGEYDRAIQEYNLVLEIDRIYEDAYYNRGQIYAVREDMPRAYQDYITYNKIVKAKTGIMAAAVPLRGLDDKRKIEGIMIPSFKDWLLEYE
jgi:tetratricopeptide (TPR) repeat protein